MNHQRPAKLQKKLDELRKMQAASAQPEKTYTIDHAVFAVRCRRFEDVEDRVYTVIQPVRLYGTVTRGAALYGMKPLIAKQFETALDHVTFLHWSAGHIGLGNYMNVTFGELDSHVKVEVA